jgi:plasmid maintenance system antidote protein VapI
MELKLYLESRHISQKELGALTGIPQSIICKLLQGKHRISAENALKIITVTDEKVTLEDLIGLRKK